MGQDPDGVAEFAADLRALRIAAGEPTYRELARKSGYSRATVHEALAGRRLPSLEVTLAAVGTLGGDAVRWRERWVAVRTADAGGPAAPTTPASPVDGPAELAPTDPGPSPAGAVPAGGAVPVGGAVAGADAVPVAVDVPVGDAVVEVGAVPLADDVPVGGAVPVGGEGPGEGRIAGADGRAGAVPVGGAHRRVLLVGAAVVVGLVVLLAAGLLLRPDRAPGPGAPAVAAGTPGCHPMARYRLTDDGNLLAPAADTTIGTVRRDDLVDLLARSDAAHRHRFVVLVERTGQVGTVDTAKLAPAGSACVTASR